MVGQHSPVAKALEGRQETDQLCDPEQSLYLTLSSSPLSISVVGTNTVS